MWVPDPEGESFGNFDLEYELVSSSQMTVERRIEPEEVASLHKVFRRCDIGEPSGDISGPEYADESLYRVAKKEKTQNGKFRVRWLKKNPKFGQIGFFFCRRTFWGIL